MNAVNDQPAAIENTGTLAGKYLTFALQRESYAIPVLRVREIIKHVPVTMVPRLPEHIRGVINLRGKIIPVVDLRAKFGLARVADTDRTCIVVVQVTAGSATRIALGLLVDGVEEVVNIAASDLEPTPDFGTSVDTNYILGMAKIKGAVKTLLDIDEVLGGERMADLRLSPSESR